MPKTLRAVCNAVAVAALPLNEIPVTAPVLSTLNAAVEPTVKRAVGFVVPMPTLPWLIIRLAAGSNVKAPVVVVTLPEPVPAPPKVRVVVWLVVLSAFIVKTSAFVPEESNGPAKVSAVRVPWTYRLPAISEVPEPFMSKSPEVIIFCEPKFGEIFVPAMPAVSDMSTLAMAPSVISVESMAVPKAAETLLASTDMPVPAPTFMVVPVLAKPFPHVYAWAPENWTKLIGSVFNVGIVLLEQTKAVSA